MFFSFPTQAGAPSAFAYHTEPETLRQKAERIAQDFNVPTTTLANLVEGESGWNPNAVGDGGCSYGLVQINLCTDNPDPFAAGYPKIEIQVTKEQARDPEYALRFAAYFLSLGQEWRWTVCSCVKGVRVLGHAVPPITSAADLVAGAPILPQGGVVKLKYGETYHLASYTIGETGLKIREFNFKPCAYTERLIPYDSKEIVGFWAPSGII